MYSKIILCYKKNQNVKHTSWYIDFHTKQQYIDKHA